jgi:serine/threonine protein kinase
MRTDNLAGGTLADRLRSGPLNRAELEQLAVDLLEMLASLHEAGKLHTDLNPETVRLDRSGRLHSSKVGTQRGADRGAKGPSGPSNYLAPELAVGKPADVAADLFACGVLLSECAGPDASAPVLVLIGMLTASEPILRPGSAREALALLGKPGAPVPPAQRQSPEQPAGQPTGRPTGQPTGEPTGQPGAPNAERPTAVAEFPPVLDFPPSEPPPVVLDSTPPAAVLPVELGGEETFDYAAYVEHRRRRRRRILIGGVAVLIAAGAAVGIGVAVNAGDEPGAQVPPPAAGAPLTQHLDDLDQAIDGITK